MPVTLASRALIVQKMDKQFNEDLKMRKDTTVVSKEKFVSVIMILMVCSRNMGNLKNSK